MNKLYDEIVQKINDDDIFIEEELLNSVKYLDKQYLENIQSLILHHFLEESQDRTIKTDLRNPIIYDSKFIDQKELKGIKYDIDKFPEKLKKILYYYIKNYFI